MQIYKKTTASRPETPAGSVLPFSIWSLLQSFSGFVYTFLIYIGPHCHLHQSLQKGKENPERAHLDPRMVLTTYRAQTSAISHCERDREMYILGEEVNSYQFWPHWANYISA